ncbi:MAG: DUF3429 domain-containing protein [Pseudomonadota bacterium]
MSLVRTLGFLGLIPFAVGVLLEFELIWAGPFWGLKLFTTYSACILSFMCGAWWGLHISKNSNHNTTWLVASNVLCLLAWVALMIGFNPLAVILLGGGFVVVWLADIKALRDHYAPVYLSLRSQLSIAVVIMHGLVLVPTVSG